MGRLPSASVAVENAAIFSRAGRIGHPAHGDVEPVGGEVLVQLGPDRRHELDFHTQIGGQIPRHGDVRTAIAAIGFAEGERLVVARRADAEHAGGADRRKVGSMRRQTGCERHGGNE